MVSHEPLNRFGTLRHSQEDTTELLQGRSDGNSITRDAGSWYALDQINRLRCRPPLTRASNSVIPVEQLVSIEISMPPQCFIRIPQMTGALAHHVGQHKACQEIYLSAFST